MKKLFILAVLAICFTMAPAQTYKVEGNTYKSTQSTQVSDTDILTPYRWEDKDGQSYPIYLSKNGRSYIIRTSKKTGNDYRKYLPEDVSRDICKKMGVEYVEKANNK